MCNLHITAGNRSYAFRHMASLLNGKIKISKPFSLRKSTGAFRNILRSPHINYCRDLIAFQKINISLRRIILFITSIDSVIFCLHTGSACLISAQISGVHGCFKKRRMPLSTHFEFFLRYRLQISVKKLSDRINSGILSLHTNVSIKN